MNPTPGPTPILIEIVGGETGFWDSPLFIAILTLGGVIVGALLGFWFNRLQDNRKAARDLAAKYMDQRLEHCSELLQAAKVVDDLLRTGGIWPSERPEFPKISEKVQEARTTIREACRRAMSSYSSITLIAPESLRRPARILVVRMMYARVLSTSAEAREAHDQLSKSIENFEAAGRKHFGAGDPAGGGLAALRKEINRKSSLASKRKERPSRNAPGV